jgi:hypothetical protein
MSIARALLAAVLANFALILPAHADKAMLVLDASGSMWGQIDGKPKMEIARDVVDDLLKGWPESTELGLVAYGHREKANCGDIQTLVNPAGKNWPAIKAAVNDIDPKGKTPITEAIRHAAKALRSEEGKATVILVSDGLETCEADPCAAASELKRAGVDFTVHVVGFGTTADENRQLQCLADNTGGKLLGASNASELKQAMKQTAALVAAPAPAPKKTNVVKVGANVGAFKTINTTHPQRMYDAAGKEVLSGYLYPDKLTDIRPGTYSLRDSTNGHVTVAGFEVAGGKQSTIDFRDYVGRLLVKNTDRSQRLYDLEGQEILSGYLYPEKDYDLQPGRYQLRDSTNGHATVTSFEIAKGQDNVVDFADHVGWLKVTKTESSQRLYDAEGKEVLSGYLYPDQTYDLPPGRYQLRDSANGQVTVESFDIQLGQETELEFGG